MRLVPRVFLFAVALATAAVLMPGCDALYGTERCRGPSGPCDGIVLEQCSLTPGCTYDHVCASVCIGPFDKPACEAIPTCFYVVGCTPKVACPTTLDAATCTANAACAWVPGCAGTRPDCWDFGDQTSCERYPTLGCSWTYN